MEFAFSPFEFFCELLAVFDFVEIRDYVVRRTFAYKGGSMSVMGLNLGELEMEGMYQERLILCRFVRRLWRLGMRCKLLLRWQRNLLKSCVQCLLLLLSLGRPCPVVEPVSM
jgi:hypothetical protein